MLNGVVKMFRRWGALVFLVALLVFLGEVVWLKWKRPNYVGDAVVNVGYLFSNRMAHFFESGSEIENRLKNELGALPCNYTARQGDGVKVAIRCQGSSSKEVEGWIQLAVGRIVSVHEKTYSLAAEYSRRRIYADSLRLQQLRRAISQEDDDDKAKADKQIILFVSQVQIGQLISQEQVEHSMDRHSYLVPGSMRVEVRSTGKLVWPVSILIALAIGVFAALLANLMKLAMQEAEGE